MEKENIRHCTLTFWLTANPTTFDLRQDIPGKVVNARITQWWIRDIVTPMALNFGDCVHYEDHYGLGFPQSCIPLWWGFHVYGGSEGIPVRFKSDELPPSMTVSVLTVREQPTLYLAADFNSVTYTGTTYKGCYFKLDYDLIPE